MKYFQVLLILFFGFSSTAFTQISNVTKTFNNTQARLNLNAALELEIDSENDVSFNFLTSSDIENGIVKSQFTRFKIKATVPWVLNIKAQTPYFNTSGRHASNDMPASVLGIKKNNNTDFIPITFSDMSLSSGGRGDVFASGNDFTADIKFTPGFQYGEGYYYITLVYTLTAM